MKWTEISKWAKSLDYKVDREKLAPREYKYAWSKGDSGGVEYHVYDTAKAIFNHHTNNMWVEHQEDYVKPTEIYTI